MHVIAPFILFFIAWRFILRDDLEQGFHLKPAPTEAETIRRREAYARAQRAYDLAHPRPSERPPCSAQDARLCVVVGVLFVGLLMLCSYAGHGYVWPINLR